MKTTSPSLAPEQLGSDVKVGTESVLSLELAPGPACCEPPPDAELQAAARAESPLTTKSARQSSIRRFITEFSSAAAEGSSTRRPCRGRRLALVNGKRRAVPGSEIRGAPT